MMKVPSDPYLWVRRVGTLISIPLVLGISPVIGCAIGWMIDRWLGTRPLATILFLGLGFAAGVRETWLIVQRAFKEDRKES